MPHPEMSDGPSRSSACRGPAIHLIGAPTDINSSFIRGAASGPTHIIRELWSGRGNLAAESGWEIGTDIRLVDDGLLPMRDMAECAADDAELLRSHVMAVCAAGGVPITLGGDHSISWPAVAGVAAQHGPLSILHVDAHPDLYADFDGNPHSHASPFARIMEQGLARRLVQVGIRTLNRHCREQAQRHGVEIIHMRDFAPDHVPVLEGPLYISIDLDGIDPSQAPGVAHPEPGGIMVRELLSMMHRQQAPVVGVDIVELNPVRDVGDVTAILAAKLVRECAALIVRNSASNAVGDAVC